METSDANDEYKAGNIMRATAILGLRNRYQDVVEAATDKLKTTNESPQETVASALKFPEDCLSVRQNLALKLLRGPLNSLEIEIKDPGLQQLSGKVALIKGALSAIADGTIERTDLAIGEILENLRDSIAKVGSEYRNFTCYPDVQATRLAVQNSLRLIGDLTPIHQQLIDYSPRQARLLHNEGEPSQNGT